MIISQYPPVNGIDLYKTGNSSWDITKVGQRFQIDGGAAEVVLVQAGAVDIAPGVLVQGPAIVAAHQGLAVPAAQAVGSTSITVTLGSTGLTLNQYQGGTAFVTAGTGAGQKYTIQENLAASATTNTALTLQSQTLAIALDTTSKISLFPNPFAGVVINPTTATDAPVGISFYTIPAGTYGYVATRGLWSCLNQGGTAVGLGLAPSTTVAGALATVAETTSQVASAAQAGFDTTYTVVSVKL